MMAPEKLRRADVVASTLLVLLGLSVIAGGLQMPLSGTYGGRPIYWYTSPAFFPLLLGVLLIGFSLGVLRRALGEGAQRGVVQYWRRELTAAAGRPESRRAVLVLAILAGYVALLSWHPFGELGPVLERIPGIFSPLTRFLVEPEGVNYFLSSVLFLAAMMLAFWRRTVWVAVIAVTLSWAVAWSSAEQLYAPLPWLD